MGTSVLSIIQSALRETNLIPLGVTPSDDQNAEAFDRLLTIVASVLGNEMGENLAPFPIGTLGINSPAGYPWWSNELPGNLFVQTNIRLMCNLTGEGFINLHPLPHDGARFGIVDVAGNFATNELTIFGNGRLIEGMPEMTYNTNGEIREWMYRGDLGNWVVVSPITLDGDMPWSAEFDDLFIIMLAMRLNPRYGQVMHPATADAYKMAKARFTARYSQSTTQVGAEDALLYTTNYYRFFGSNRPPYGDPNTTFLSGFPFF
jgi:hypothetical protein